jgi:pantetheine-phosphate adenylyltransferase
MPNPQRIAVYPGTFDPPTNGHVDVITRGAGLFDRVIVGVLENTGKQPRFSRSDRVDMLRELFADRPGVDVAAFDGLLVDFVRARGARVILRGVRSAVDLDYERQMALTNRHLAPEVDSVFLLASADVANISSTLVREIAALGGSVRGLVPPSVEARLARPAGPPDKVRA